MNSFVTRWLKLSLVAIMGCGFLAMMIYALINRDEIRSSQVEPPLITPPAEPLKRRPDQPGGLQIPNRDKLVFDLLDSSNTTLGDTGVKLTKDEVSASDPIAEVVQTEMGDETSGTTAIAPITAAAVVTPTAVVPALKAEVKAAVKVTETVAVAPVKAAETKIEPKIVTKPEPKVEAKKIEEKPAAKVAGGKWGVQLAAVNTQADGNAMAAKAAKDFAPLKVLSPRVVAAPGTKKYRVQFVGLKDRTAAAGVCAKLAGKQPCFPVSIP